MSELSSISGGYYLFLFITYPVQKGLFLSFNHSLSPRFPPSLPSSLRKQSPTNGILRVRGFALQSETVIMEEPLSFSNGSMAMLLTPNSGATTCLMPRPALCICRQCFWGEMPPLATLGMVTGGLLPGSDAEPF